MKTLILISLLAAAVVLWATGCGTLLGTHAGQSSLPVELGASTTNTPNAVAYLQLAKVINASANPTPTEAPINTALDGLIALAAMASGYWVHRNGVSHGAAVGAAATLAAAPPPKQ